MNATVHMSAGEVEPPPQHRTRLGQIGPGEVGAIMRPMILVDHGWPAYKEAQRRARILLGTHEIELLSFEQTEDGDLISQWQTKEILG